MHSQKQKMCGICKMKLYINFLFLFFILFLLQQVYLIGINEINENHSKFADFLIASYTVYGILVFENAIHFLDLATQDKVKYSNFIFYFMAGIILIFFVTILFTGAFCLNKGEWLQYGIVLLMILHRYVMAYFNSHKERFLVTRIGEVFESSLKN